MGTFEFGIMQTENFAKSALHFCGLLMGDFSRCGIHSMFNTATVIGINSNIFGSGFPRTFIPSFSYGGAQGFQTHAFRKAMESNAGHDGTQRGTTFRS